MRAIPGVLKSAFAEQHSIKGDGVRQLHCHLIAAALKLLVFNDQQAGAVKDAVEKMWDTIALREYVHGPSDPRVVQELFFLQCMLRSCGKAEEAMRTEEDGIGRMETYLDDIPALKDRLPTREELAKQVLAWITCAMRPLTTVDLLCVLGLPFRLLVALSYSLGRPGRVPPNV